MKKLVCISVLLWAVCSAQAVFAYSDDTTHPALTQEIIDFYNRSFPGSVTAEEAEWIIEGSMLEDTPPRWINHFLDPVSGEGWRGEKTGIIDPGTVRALSAMGLSTAEPLSAIAWISSYVAQDRYRAYGGNRSWGRGLELFVAGDRREAYLSLGAALHLLEDMTVPDHTRNDTHAHAIEGLTGDPGSPYENYTAKWNRETIKALNIPANLSAAGFKPIKEYTIADYLEKTAQYSNNFFFSKDTINDPKYALPSITREDDNFAYGKDENGSEFVLARIESRISEEKFIKNIVLDQKPKDYPILDGYFDRLARRAILAGAGVVDLWKHKAEDAIVNQEYPEHIVKLDPDALKYINPPTFSFVGEMQKFANTVSSGISNVSRWFGNIFKKSGNEGAFVLGSFPVADTPTEVEVVSTVDNFGEAQDSEGAGDVLGAVTNEKTQPWIPHQVRDDIQNDEGIQTDEGTEIILGVVSVRDDANIASNRTENATDGELTRGSAAQSGGSAANSESVSSGSVAPSAPAPIVRAGPAITNFDAVFVSSSMEIIVSWDEARDADGATSTVSYALRDTSADPRELYAGTSTRVAFGISEVGRDYRFELAVTDARGATTNAETTRTVPSFLSGLRLVRDPRAQGAQYLDMSYAGAPFIPPVSSVPLAGSAKWQAVVFYLNREANAENVRIAEANLWQVEHRDGVLTLGGTPAEDSYRFALRADDVHANGSGLSTSQLLPQEDMRVSLGLASSTDALPLGAGDYITAGYYDFAHVFDQALTLVAVDKTHFVIDPSAASHPPTAPADPVVTFDDRALRLSLAWGASTDPDSADDQLTYEINISTSTELLADRWSANDCCGAIGRRLSAVIDLVFPESYTIGVRARDDRGLISPETTVRWSFPDGFSPLITSDMKNSASQDFVPTIGGELASLTVSTVDFATESRNPYTNICSVDIYEVTDAGAVLIASSDAPNPPDGSSGAYAFRGPECAGEPVFTFAAHPVLETGKTYRWAFHFSSGYGAVRFYGTALNTVGGLFTDARVLNAKFSARATGGELSAGH